MNNKKSTKKLVAYEIYNIIGNPFSSFFGIVFPILMLLIITNAIKGDVPKSMAAQANTSIFITMSLITPMAIIFLAMPLPIRRNWRMIFRFAWGYSASQSVS